MHNITAHDGVAAKSFRVGPVPYFKNSAMNQRSVALQEVFYVVAILRASRVKIRNWDRLQSTEIAKPNMVLRRCGIGVKKLLDPRGEQSSEDPYSHRRICRW